MTIRARPWPIWLNVFGYQLVWLACVAGAGRGPVWLGPVAAICFVGATLLWGGKRDCDLRSLLLALPIGFALDSSFAASGWLVYAQPWPWPFAAPAWIWAIWAAFAMTLNHSLGFLAGRPRLALALGLAGGPLAYWTAARSFSAVRFGAPESWVLLALALGWAAVLPILFALNRRYTTQVAMA